MSKLSHINTRMLLQEAEQILATKSERHSTDIVHEIQSVSIKLRGNFTIAVVNDSFIGVTKRNAKTDKYRVTTGYKTALARAIDDMMFASTPDTEIRITKVQL